MTTTGPNNALAEVALALAMGFFSIMVLALVSMGAGIKNEKKDPINVSKGVILSPSVSAKKDNNRSTKITPPNSLLIFFQGRFLDAQLREVTPEIWEPKDEVVLAIEPNISMGEAISLQKKINTKNITITTLDKKWLSTLKDKFQ